jgi:hypothetical protein
MRSHDLGPPLTPIERPRCAKCRLRMALVQIKPGPSGVDYRIFECSRCDVINTVTVADPMKSGTVNRLADNLKPPR